MEAERVVVYIDGSNLHHGPHLRPPQDIPVADLVALSRSPLKPRQDLVLVRYFTTRVRNDPAATERQADFSDALQAVAASRSTTGTSCRRA
jgi:hypothetical protein